MSANQAIVVVVPMLGITTITPNPPSIVLVQGQGPSIVVQQPGN